jgi:hypothetical protein
MLHGVVCEPQRQSAAAATTRHFTASGTLPEARISICRV